MSQLLLGKIEEFISLVRSRPALYNFTLDEFNDKEITEQLWKEIAHEFNTNVNYCKTKWSVLRVSFARQMRNEKTNAKRTTETLINDWYLKDNMSFMRSYMRKRKKAKSTENCKIDSISKSNFKVKTEKNLSNSSIVIKNEPLNEDENEGIECLEIFVDDDVSELRPDFLSIASSSPLSNSEAIKIENEVINTTQISGSSQKRKTIEQQDQSLSVSKRIPTDQDCEPSLNRKVFKAEGPLLLSSPRRNTMEQEDSSQTSFISNLNDDPTITFFKSILPDFNKLTGRRQRLLKQKVMGELHLLLDEQENES